MALSLEWTKGCRNEEEKQAREELVRNNPKLLEVIQAVLVRKLQEVRKIQIKASNYTTASWPYKQADHIGYERALTEVLELMETTKHDR